MTVPTNDDGRGVQTSSAVSASTNKEGNPMHEDTPVSHDAEEFGVHIRSGGWRLGLLVARSVEKGTGNGRPPKGQSETVAVTKVSAAEFARRSKTSTDRVLRYLEAWGRASAAGVVPPAEELNPGVEIGLPDDEAAPWGGYYHAGRSSTDDSVRRSIKAVERNIENDPEFADAVARKVAEVTMGTVEAKAERARELLSDPEVADATFSDDGADEAERNARTAIARKVVSRDRADESPNKPALDRMGEELDAASEIVRARKALGRALDSIQRLDDRGELERFRPHLNRQVNSVEVVLDWMRTYLDSGDTSFESELADLLAGDGER